MTGDTRPAAPRVDAYCLSLDARTQTVPVWRQRFFGLAQLARELEREADRDRGDAATMRGYIATFKETPSMTASQRDRLLKDRAKLVDALKEAELKLAGGLRFHIKQLLRELGELT